MILIVSKDEAEYLREVVGHDLSVLSDFHGTELILEKSIAKELLKKLDKAIDLV